MGERDALFGRIADYYAGFFGTWLLSIGRRARLFETLRDRGPLTADELAAALGYEPRYVATWCRGAYAFELLDEADGRFALVEHGAELLLDPTSPAFMGGRADFFPMLTPDFEMYPARLADGGRYPLAERPAEVVQTMQAAARADGPTMIRHVVAGDAELERTLREGGRILDAGCGAGYLLEAFADAFPASELVGIEIDPASVEAARERAGARARVERLHLLEAPFRDEFDLAYANISLSHTWGASPEIFAALHRAVKPGGRLICCDVPYPDGLEELRSTPGRLFTGVTVYVSLLGFQLLTPSSLLGGMRAAGFADARIAAQPARTRMMAIGTKARAT